MTTSQLDLAARSLADGEPLSAATLAALASEPDILRLGMVADEARRRATGRRVTYALVATVAVDGAPLSEVPADAVEVRLTGAPASLVSAVEAVRAAVAVAGDRVVSGFSLAHLTALAGATGLAGVLQALRSAGLSRVAEAPIDGMAEPERSVGAVADAGFPELRLTIDRVPAGPRRSEAMLVARDLCARFPFITAVSPLPMVLNAFRPTTGYDDVRAVALARLAMPSGPAIQVDWLRYGPKLAQVALTFGADDLDDVPPVTPGVEGVRRGTLAELTRNIESAGYEAVARRGSLVR